MQFQRKPRRLKSILTFMTINKTLIFFCSVENNLHSIPLLLKPVFHFKLENLWKSLLLICTIKMSRSTQIYISKLIMMGIFFVAWRSRLFMCSGTQVKRHESSQYTGILCCIIGYLIGIPFGSRHLTLKLAV